MPSALDSLPRSPRPSRRPRRFGARDATLAVVLAAAVSLPLVRAPFAFAGDEASSPGDEREQTARRHFVAGDAAFKAEHYDVALREFEAGYADSPRPGFLLNMGHCWRKLGELRKARALYKKYLVVDGTSRLRAEVEAVIAELDGALADEDLADREQRSRTAPPPAPPPAPAPVVPPRTLPAAEAPPAEPPVLVTPPPRASASDAPAPGGAPFYQRTWFWVTVGAVAVAGAAGAVYASQRSSGEPFHASGTLGALGD